jgi:hypothetical protein
MEEALGSWFLSLYVLYFCLCVVDLNPNSNLLTTFLSYSLLPCCLAASALGKLRHIRIYKLRASLPAPGGVFPLTFSNVPFFTSVGAEGCTGVDRQ